MRTRMNFYFSEALRSLSTNKATSMAAVIAMLVALLIVGITSAAYTKAHKEGQRIQRDAGLVKVFLTETATESQVNALRSKLDDDSNVQSTDYVSKNTALKRARKLFADSPDVISNLSGNPFPASLEATLVDPTRMNAVSKTMEGQPGVSQVKTGGASAKKAITFIQVGTTVFFVIGIGILIAATVLVANTIRLSIYSRRREIEVMKLVGASNSFVRVPFMIEGFLCGVVAALLAIVAVLATLKTLSRVMAEALGTDKLGETSSSIPLAQIALGLLVLGIALGIAGSASSMRKYLRT